MNIILDKSLITDSKQPKVFELGQITTTLQELLDNSTIVINGEQTIVLSITDENNNILKYLLPLDYKGDSFYGLGKNILASDLISLGSIKTIPYKVYTALLTQSNTSAPTANVLDTGLENTPTFSYVGTGQFGLVIPDYMDNKTVVFISNTIGTTSDRVQIYNNGSGFFEICTYNSAGEKKNKVLLDTPIEIRVYD